MGYGKPDIFHKIKDFGKSSQTQPTDFTNDQIGNYEEGIEKYSNGVTKTAKEIFFDDLGEFCDYAEGKEELPNEVTKTVRSLSLYDGKLSCYKEGIETKPEAP